MTIGIGGVSRSGKSTLAALIYHLFTDGTSLKNRERSNDFKYGILDFSEAQPKSESRNPKYTEGGQTAVILSQDDYVFPTEQIPKIKHGEEIEIDWEVPESIDFQRYKVAILNAQKQFDHVITEGLLNFHDTEINRLFDKFFFVDISKATFLSRKVADKRWGEVPDWYIEHIWESYERLGKTVLNDENQTIFVLSGEVDFDIEAVKKAIKNDPKVSF